MTVVPPSIGAAVEEELARQGFAVPIDEATPIGGGCTHNGTRITTQDGPLFLKWNDRPNADAMFAAEEEGLSALRSAAARSGSTAIVPRPIGAGVAVAGAWLLMEYYEPAPPAVGSGSVLGKALAAIHSVGGDPNGWPRDNWIGSLRQPNTPAAGWADFWRDQRIVPQLERARQAGRATESIFDELLDVIPAALDGARSGSLLHGDLWSGNAFYTEGGRPVLIDPAVYHGDAEVDLAMAELFGGFDTGVYDAYDEVRPISDEYASHRRALYQLYYLLVHLNLFGHAYEPGSRAAAERVVAALR